MNTKQLTYFIEIAKQESFTKASQQLFICQSALSKTIKVLEEELGVQLIDRVSKGFCLTQEGRLLYEHGQIALKRIEDEMNGLYDSINVAKGVISVGIPPVIGTAYFTKIIDEFCKKYPDIKLRIVEAGANSVKEKVEKGEIDIGVVILPFSSNAFKVTQVIKADNVLVVNREHPLAERQEVDFAELKDEKFIILNKSFMLHDRILDLCGEAGFAPRITCESSQWDFIASMVAMNQGVTILPRPIMRKYKSDDIRVISLKNPEFPWDIALIVKKDKYISKSIQSFVETATVKQKI